MSTSPLIFLQLSRIPDDDDYLAQIVASPRRMSGHERFRLADADEVFRSDDDTAQTLSDLKVAIDGGLARLAEMERLGEFLYNRVFTGLVERKLNDVMIQEKERPYRLCIRIDENAPLLETVPWEYMKRRGDFVALSLATVSRVLEDRPAQSFDPCDGATMLLVYANPPEYGNDSVRHARIEAASIAFINDFLPDLETKYNLKVTKLFHEDANRENFLRLLSEEYFDIVHFIGHGEVLNGKGNIVMHDDLRIPGPEIYSNLSNKPPRLFYFNSCSTAKANNRDPFSSVAQALITPELSAVPAVIAMQYEIEVNDSFVIAEEFYERLLNPKSDTFGNLERSMDHARRKLQRRNPSWGIPVLFLQTRERVMLFGELPPERPPAQLKSHLASNIPAAPDLVNRKAEVASVGDLLSSDQRLLMVTGLPGVGRGAVVRTGLDQYLQDEREEIPIWLNLEGLKPEDATLGTLYLSLDRILEAGLERLWFQRRPLSEKLAELEAKIPNTAIIVLENIDALLDEECRFRDETLEQFFLHFGKTKRRIFIVITSTFEPAPRVNADEWTKLWQSVRVKSLTIDDAVKLLRKQGLTQEDQELRSLAEAADGNPQVLKIFAAGIREGSVSPQRFASTQTPVPGLAGAFNRILDSLTEVEATALKAWSVFRNPVLRDALTHNFGNDSTVDSMVTKHLLNVKDGYYFLPVLIRNYAYRELQQEPLLLDQAHEAAAFFFLDEVKRILDLSDLTPNRALDTERVNNFLEVRYHLRERTDDVSRDWAQNIAEAIFQALMDLGRHNELRVLIEQSEPEFSRHFKVQFFKAQLERLAGLFENALDLLDLLDVNVERDSLEQGYVANEIGVVFKERSDPRDSDKMLQYFEAAYEIFAKIIRTSEDEDLIKRAHYVQAICTYNRGHVYQYFRRGQTLAQFNEAYSQARTFYEAALDIYQTLEEPDEPGIALVFCQLGELLADTRFAENNPKQAEKYFGDALAIAERIGYPRIEAHAAYQFARFVRRRGDSEMARVLFRRAADLAEQISLPNERAIAEVQIAEIDFKKRQYDREMLDAALTRNEETLSQYDDLHSVRVQSDAYFLHGQLHLVRNDQERAIECFESSRSVMMNIESLSRSRADARRIARGTFFLAQIALAREGAEAARRMIVEMKEHFERIGYTLGDNEPVTEFMGRINEWRS